MHPAELGYKLGIDEYRISGGKAQKARKLEASHMAKFLEQIYFTGLYITEGEKQPECEESQRYFADAESRVAAISLPSALMFLYTINLAKQQG